MRPNLTLCIADSRAWPLYTDCPVLLCFHGQNSPVLLLVDHDVTFQGRFGRACLPRVLGLEDFVQLLKRPAFSFHKASMRLARIPQELCGSLVERHSQEVNKCKLEYVPKHEEDIEPVSDLSASAYVNPGRSGTYVSEGDWRCESVDKASTARGQLEDPHPFGSHVV